MTLRRTQARSDEADFQAIYDRYSREVWAIIYARWLQNDAAIDIMQETFLRYWKHCQSRTEPIREPRPWLLRVARNLAEDYRKNAFQRNGTWQPQEFNGIAGKSQRPSDSMEQQEVFARIRQVVAALPSADREILTLRYAMDYDAPQIAEILGLSIAAVHMRLSRARQKAAETLEAEGLTKAP
jgi:RNA polymerase sigma-70 factor (ECF subfamily)